MSRWTCWRNSKEILNVLFNCLWLLDGKRAKVHPDKSHLAPLQPLNKDTYSSNARILKTGLVADKDENKTVSQTRIEGPKKITITSRFLNCFGIGCNDEQARAVRFWDWAGSGLYLLKRTLSSRCSTPPDAQAADSIMAYIVSWNMNGGIPQTDLKPLFGHPLEPPSLRPFKNSNLIVISAQECERSILESVLLGTASCPTWQALLDTHLSPIYTLVASDTLASLHLSIYARTDWIETIKSVEKEKCALGVARVLGNKGAIALKLTLGNRKSSVTFIGAHLCAGQDRKTQRDCQVEKLFANVSLLEVKHVFFFGDLNYRICNSRIVVEEMVQELSANAAQNPLGYKTLLEWDELSVKVNPVFDGFKEHEIEFPPTYKFDVYSDNYDTTAKQRVPSWTDRILYKTSKDGLQNMDTGSNIPEIECLLYNSCRTIKSSDHRPVVGLYKIPI